MNIQDLVDQEIEQRDEVRKLIMSHVQTLCEVGKGWVKRGVLNQYVYQALGWSIVRSIRILPTAR